MTGAEVTVLPDPVTQWCGEGAMLISPVSVSGVTMHGLSHLQTGSTLEALTQATIILILAVAIVISNLIVVATYLNFKGELL